MDRLALGQGLDGEIKMEQTTFDLDEPTIGGPTIPKRFIRIWLGRAPIPELFEGWWQEFRTLHPDFEFLTIGNEEASALVPPEFRSIYEDCSSYAEIADLVRILALHQYGGIYIDADVMPLRPFYPLLDDTRLFIGQRSSVAFESAIIGSPANHRALNDAIDALPAWYWSHQDRTIPLAGCFVTSVWFGRSDVRHLPQTAFYPYNGFCAPTRAEKLRIFEEKKFPIDMYCAHFSNHRWGGKPRNIQSAQATPPQR